MERPPPGVLCHQAGVVVGTSLGAKSGLLPAACRMLEDASHVHLARAPTVPGLPWPGEDGEERGEREEERGFYWHVRAT